MRVLSNAELTQRLEKLEQSFFASRNREVDNTYRSEDALNKADALTPYTETKTAYIGDTTVAFNNVPSGNLSIFTDKPLDYSYTKDNGIVVISFDELSEVINITISIL